MSLLKKIWNDPVGSKLIANAIWSCLVFASYETYTHYGLRWAYLHTIHFPAVPVFKAATVASALSIVSYIVTAVVGVWAARLANQTRKAAMDAAELAEMQKYLTLGPNDPKY